LESYIKEAREKGIDSIVLTDDDWQRWEYGLWPFRRLLKRVVEKKSVMSFGIERYLGLIKEMNEKYKDVVTIDGVQTLPFYYWSGNFLKGNMSLNNRNKDMLVIGLGDAGSYKDMPLVANHRSRFDAYHGDKSTEPYQDLIDYVVEKGGLIFWSHPEFEENTVVSGIRLLTVPYPWDLVGTYDYTGFGIFWEGYKKLGIPKGIWDRVLTEYCQGKRRSPIWAIGELEAKGRGMVEFEDILNIVYVKKLDRRNILDALKKGRFYATLCLFDRVPLVLEEFIVTDETGTKTAVMGEHASFPEDPIIKIRVRHERPTDGNITVRLIRNNEIVKQFSGNREIRLEYKDEGLVKGQKYYYRIDVTDNTATQVISNPIFFMKGPD
jgi:hypothetical protein